MPVIKIADKFDVSSECIRSVVRKNIPKEYRSLSEQRQKYTRNSNYFDKINTEEKAYWLGFLYADGSVNLDRNKLRLGLNSDDIKHIEKFKASIETNAPIHQSKKIDKGKVYYQSFIELGDKYLVNRLNELGCGHNKALTLTFPNFLDDDKILPFIRGYFDGDGSIHISKIYKPTGHKYYKINIVGTKNILLHIRHYLDVPDLKLYKNGKIFVLYISGNKQVEDVLDKLYKNSNIHLDRKFDYYYEVKKYNAQKYDN